MTQCVGMHRRRARGCSAEILRLIAEYDGDERTCWFLELEAAKPEVVPESIVGILEAIGPLVTLAARMNDDVVTSKRDFEAVVKFVLQQGLHLGCCVRN